ncbi:phage-related protein [Candidatus Termititenax aidoneus]|uniref:Phage-related protein n=1 Tax=Termititenax aidoneus TaxID=2218524 RepID=A0A388TBX0_TERA1|nr:phage-related protein [Candidatus Termititenax aidoneus]
MERAKIYKMRFIQPGLCGYISEGDGVVLIQKPALDRMAESFKGMPIFNEHHTDLSKDELIRAFLKDSVGIVSAVSWNPETAWYEGEIIIWDEAAANNIDSGEYFPSCAYMPSENGINDGGGEWHNVHYDSEILDGEYTHLAIVKNPRYEDAKFYNSKGENRMRIFNLLNGKKDEKKNETTPPKDKNDEEQKPPEEKQNDTVDPNDVVDVGGTQVKLGDLIANYKKQKPVGDAETPKENGLALDDQVEIAPGVTVQISELVQAWTEKENSILPQDTQANPVIQEKQNSKDQKVNQELKNSMTKGGVVVPEIETAETRIKIGNARYSLKEEK